MTLINIEGCRECCFLSTCNRVEVIFVASDPVAAAVAVRSFLFARSGLSDAEAQQYSYLYRAGMRLTIFIMWRPASIPWWWGNPRFWGN
jgi:glutamyl-tRNA reductase